MNREERFFWTGALFGLMAGIIGNILVSSCFVLITQSYKNNLGRYGTFLILILSLIIFLVLTYYLIKKVGAKK